MLDFIEEVDEVCGKEIIDFAHNTYGDKFIDFLLNSNCCILAVF